MASIPPPRLFVITAREADEAVIFRKGPASWCHIVRWNLRDDTFQRGAWIRARVYAERCDLSPNGKLLLYFALQGNRWQTSYRGTYTAVSRTPWLEALVLWPQGDTWGGGGRFATGSHVLLRSGWGTTRHPRHADPAITCSTADVGYHTSTGEVEGAEWSGRDRHGNLLFTRAGKIFRRGKSGDNELIDLCGLKPDPQPAPRCAGDRLQRFGKNSDV